MHRASTVFVIALSTLILSLMLPALFVQPGSRLQAQPATPARPTQEGRQSQCAGSLEASRLPTDTIRLCESITNTVTITPECAYCLGGINIVFVRPELAGADVWTRLVAGSMITELERYAREYERDFRRPFLIQGGVVSYDADRVSRAQPMTTQLGRVESAVQRIMYGVGQDGGPYDDAARMAVRMLQEAERSDEAAGYPPCLEIVVFFGSFEGATGDRMMLTANVLRAKSIIEARTRQLYVGCSAEDTLGGCGFFAYMQPNSRLFSSRFQSRDKFRGVMVGEMRDVRERHEARPPEYLRSASLFQRIPISMSYLAGSAQPPPAEVLTGTDSTILRWDWDPYRAMEPRSVQYSARPNALGQHHIEGWAELEDLQGLRRQIPMSSLAISVTEPCAPPTPTPSPTSTITPTPPPSATPLPATATPTPSATSTPTATPTTTPTPEPRALFLPLALNERCLPERRRVDVVLVLDASTSMDDVIPGSSRSKIDAARAAAKAFLDELDLASGDRAAIVSFNAEARMAQTLTADRAALVSAIDGIELAQQTCLVCAVSMADDELSSERHTPTSQAAMIVLTDGRSNPQPVAEAVDRARLARDRGVIVFTIGLGEDIEAEALVEMASRPEFAFRAADESTLEEIYRNVARNIPCPPAAFWGGR